MTENQNTVAAQTTYSESYGSQMERVVMLKVIMEPRLTGEHFYLSLQKLGFLVFVEYVCD